MENQKYQFTSYMLPLFGVTWNTFETEAEADAFMIWAEKQTENDAHPCDAYYCGWNGEGYEVKVKNW
jgi:hypothetical protein